MAGRPWRQGGERARRRRGRCGKLVYRSAGDAKRAHGRASYRIRVYFCRVCGGHHVTAQEKGDD